MDDIQGIPDKEEPAGQAVDAKQPKPEYKTPTVTTYTEEQILDELGPAQALQSAIGENPFGM